MNFRPWSYSRIKTYQECQRRFYLQYVKKLKTVPTEAMIEGKRRHKAIEFLINDNNGTENKNVDVDITANDINVFERIKRFTGGFTAETFLAVNDKGALAKDNKTAYLRGIIDATDKRTTIIDWKCGATLTHDQLQMDIYFVLAAAWYHIVDNVFLGSFIFPYINMESKNVPAKTYRYDMQNCASFFEKIKLIIGEIELAIDAKNADAPDDWEPDTAKCGDCLCWQGCERYNKPVKIDKDIARFPAVLTSDTAPQAAEFLENLKALIKKGETALKVYCTNNGNLTLSDGCGYGHHIKEKRKITDARQLITALSKAGVSKETYWKALNLSPTNALKLCKEAGIDSDEYIAVQEQKGFGVIK